MRVQWSIRGQGVILNFDERKRQSVDSLTVSDNVFNPMFPTKQTNKRPHHPPKEKEKLLCGGDDEAKPRFIHRKHTENF